MRSQLAKLNKKQSTKSERRVGEILKRHRIKFRTKQKIGLYEVDFIIGRVIVEVDGNVHDQINQQRESYLFSQGYTPLHIQAHGLSSEAIEKELIYLIKTNNYDRRSETGH